MTKEQKRFFSLHDAEFEKEIEEICKAPSDEKCGICGKDITFEDDINYPDSPECCEEHGFINLCPEHQEWFWMSQEDVIKDQCIKKVYQQIINQPPVDFHKVN